MNKKITSSFSSFRFLFKNYFLVYKREDRLFNNKIALSFNVLFYLFFVLVIVLGFYKSFEHYDIIIDYFNKHNEDYKMNYSIIYKFWNEFSFLFVFFILFSFVSTFFDFLKMISYSEIKSINIALLQILPLSKKVEISFLTGIFVFQRTVFSAITFLPLSLLFLFLGYTLPILYFILTLSLVLFSIAFCWLIFFIASFMKTLFGSFFVVFSSLVIVCFYKYILLNSLLDNLLNISTVVKPNELLNIIEYKFLIFNLVCFPLSVIFLFLVLVIVSIRLDKIKSFLVYNKLNNDKNIIFNLSFKSPNFNIFILFWKNIVRDKSFIINFILLIAVQLFFIFKDFFLGQDSEVETVFYILLLSMSLSFQSNLLIHTYSFSRSILLTTPYKWNSLSSKIHHFALLPLIGLLLFLMFIGIIFEGLKMSALLIVILCLICNQEFYKFKPEQLCVSGEKKEMNRIIILKNKTMSIILEFGFYVILLMYIMMF